MYVRCDTRGTTDSGRLAAKFGSGRHPDTTTASRRSHEVPVVSSTVDQVLFVPSHTPASSNQGKRSLSTSTRCRCSMYSSGHHAGHFRSHSPPSWGPPSDTPNSPGENCEGVSTRLAPAERFVEPEPELELELEPESELESRAAAGRRFFFLRRRFRLDEASPPGASSSPSASPPDKGRSAGGHEGGACKNHNNERKQQEGPQAVPGQRGKVS